MGKNILILGGTAEAANLATRLSRIDDNHVVTSLAGRTANPGLVAGEVRTGGFGGVEGLVSYLHLNNIELLIDATHPYATRISNHARLAASLADVKLEAHIRPAWQRENGDRWTCVLDETEAAALLPVGARVFLAIGSQHIAPFFPRNDLYFLVRMIDPPRISLPFTKHDLALAKPGKDANSEAALLQKYRITHVVCRNSGGTASYQKLVAARNLGLEVFMLRRPLLQTPGHEKPKK